MTNRLALCDKNIRISDEPRDRGLAQLLSPGRFNRDLFWTDEMIEGSGIFQRVVSYR